MRTLIVFVLGAFAASAAAAPPTDDPAAKLKLEWTGKLPWATVVSIDEFAGHSVDQKLEAAQDKLAQQGGVVYFPAGEYRFKNSISLRNGIILRGADPGQVNLAIDDRYSPPTKFIFPKYEPKLEGDGTPNDTAFKGIHLQKPETDSNCGLVNIDVHYGHVHFAEGADHKVGRNRLVAGCVFRSAARLEHGVPDKAQGQHGWQRWTGRHLAAIHVYSEENALIWNNRLPDSSADDFEMPGFRMQGRGKDSGKTIEVPRGVFFDYNNRPGIRVNHFSIGGGGGADPKGTPQTHPHGFRKGTVIWLNYVYSTGRCAIAFTGDGVNCSFNKIRFKMDVIRHTHTGTSAASGSSTNDNRGIEMRGWRWTLERNDYQVYRNRAGDSKVYINDGEGMMHEGHANSTVKDSKLIGNRGNSYISIYKTAGVDGLLVEFNRISTPGGISAIYVVADRNWDRHPCRNVKIRDNWTSGSGIQIAGEPGENNVISGNKHEGPGGKITNKANAKVLDNEGYEIVGP